MIQFKKARFNFISQHYQHAALAAKAIRCTSQWAPEISLGSKAQLIKLH